MLLMYALSKQRSTTVTTLHCNAQTTAENVVQRIQQACVEQHSNTGRVLRPRSGDRLVLYLKDINLPKPDKYDTCMLIAFLQQLITFKGFYNENLEFVTLERIHIVCSMNPATTVGAIHCLHALRLLYTLPTLITQKRMSWCPYTPVFWKRLLKTKRLRKAASNRRRKLESLRILWLSYIIKSKQNLVLMIIDIISLLHVI